VNILTQFASKFRESLTFFIYAVLAFLLIISGDNQIVRGVRATSLGFFGFIQDNINSVGSYFYLEQENKILHLENTKLSNENRQLQNALLENIRLRKLLQFKRELNFNFIPARVIGFSPQDLVTGFLLSTDDYDFIKENNAVITTDGLVGKIITMSGKYVVCQNLMDPNIRVSVRIQRNRELGMISWAGQNLLQLNYVPNTVKVKKGDVVYTSGMSQIFPPNIKVGVITGFRENLHQLFQTIWVRPTVNLNNLEEVFILQTHLDHESGK